tara:strand:- start:5436 stop:5810 length:375 start_codon:yes stop_codon:yes gene_type:complete
MECAICYEEFFIINSKEEYSIKKNNFISELQLSDYDKEKNFYEILKFRGLHITPDYDPRHYCNTDNCNSKICDSCWKKMTEIEYKCPFCREFNKKDYFNYEVLAELQANILNEEELVDLIWGDK